MDTRDTTAPVTAELGALTHQFLAAVSFEQGERPRYDTIRDLFIGEGLLIKNSSDSPEVSSVDEFIQSRQQVLDSGALTSFREVEIADVTEAFGNVAHRFSTYDKRGTMAYGPHKPKRCNRTAGRRYSSTRSRSRARVRSSALGRV